MQASLEEMRQALQTPLLGDEHHHDDDDVIDTEMMMMDNDEDDIDDDDTATSLCCNDTVIIWILLLSQFGMAFMLHDESTAHLSWPICNFSIFLFSITAWLFRHACVESNATNMKVKKNKPATTPPVLLLLAPEICMDIILALVLFNQVELGFIAMLASMLLLSGFVVVTTAHYLYCRGQEEVHKEKEEQEKIAIARVCIV